MLQSHMVKLHNIEKIAGSNNKKCSNLKHQEKSSSTALLGPNEHAEDIKIKSAMHYWIKNHVQRMSGGCCP